jgi:hypothetical protein
MCCGGAILLRWASEGTIVCLELLHHLGAMVRLSVVDLGGASQHPRGRPGISPPFPVAARRATQVFLYLVRSASPRIPRRSPAPHGECKGERHAAPWRDAGRFRSSLPQGRVVVPPGPFGRTFRLEFVSRYPVLSGAQVRLWITGSRTKAPDERRKPRTFVGALAGKAKSQLPGICGKYDCTVIAGAARRYDEAQEDYHLGYGEFFPLRRRDAAGHRIQLRARYFRRRRPRRRIHLGIFRRDPGPFLLSVREAYGILGHASGPS